MYYGPYLYYADAVRAQSQLSAAGWVTRITTDGDGNYVVYYW